MLHRQQAEKYRVLALLLAIYKNMSCPVHAKLVLPDCHKSFYSLGTELINPLISTSRFSPTDQLNRALFNDRDGEQDQPGAPGYNQGA